MAITIKEIAKLAGVSITTVSRVINNKKEGVSENKRKEIQQIIAEHNYQPNNIARSLVANSTKTIGLVVPDITNPFFPEMTRGVEDIFVANGYTLLLCSSDGNAQKEIHCLEILKEKRVDGAIFTVCNPDNQKLVDLALESDIPLVFTDEPYFSDILPGVFSNDYEGGYKAAKFLIDNRHCNIACFAGSKKRASVQQRVSGYKAALNDAHIPINDQNIFYGNYDIDTGYRLMQSLMDSSNNVTAVFATNDLIAYGIYQAATDRGLKIPEDISVIGFDDLIISKFLTPALTTVRVDAYKMGAMAAQLLLKKLKHKPIPDTALWMKPEVISRNSVLYRT